MIFGNGLSARVVNHFPPSGGALNGGGATQPLFICIRCVWHIVICKPIRFCVSGIALFCNTLSRSRLFGGGGCRAVASHSCYEDPQKKSWRSKCRRCFAKHLSSSAIYHVRMAVKNADGCPHGPHLYRRAFTILLRRLFPFFCHDGDWRHETLATPPSLAA